MSAPKEGPRVAPALGDDLPPAARLSGSSEIPDWALDVVKDEPPLIPWARAAHLRGVSERTLTREAERGKLVRIRGEDSGSSRSFAPRLAFARYLASLVANPKRRKKCGRSVAGATKSKGQDS